MNIKGKTSYGFILLGVYMSVSLFMGFYQPKSGAKDIIIEAPESRFFMKEDVQSRQDYMHQIQADPKTGTIPPNIRQKELSFAKEVLAENIRDRFQFSQEDSEQQQVSQLLDWKSIGPYNIGGRTRALALDVLNEQIILAGGVSGGMWRSTDSGESWTKTTTVDQLQSVTAITQNVKPGMENIWYYGTGELVGNSSRAAGAPFRGDGIFKSTNNGQSWELLPATSINQPGSFTSPFQYIWDITTNPNGGDDEILAAVFGGIVRSTDGGATWTTVLGDDRLNLPANSDLNEIPTIFYTDIHRTSSGVFYATLSSETSDNVLLSTKAGVWRSEDGEQWTRIASFVNLPTQRVEIGSSPSRPEIVYFLAAIRDGRTGLFRFEEGGQFEDLSTNLPNGSNGIEQLDTQNSYNLVIEVHPNNPDIVYVGGTNLYRSTDGFQSQNNTTWIGGYDPEAENVELYENHHPDQHAIVFLPSNQDVMYTANDGGIFVTNNNRAQQVSYRSLNNGFITTQFYSATFSRFVQDDFVFGGTQDNGSLLTFNNDALQANGINVLGGDGGYTGSTPFGIYYYMSFQNARIFRLTLNKSGEITTFARVDPVGGGSNPSQPYLFINPFVLDPNNANRMYLAGGDFVWYNRNLSQIPAGQQQAQSLNWERIDQTQLRENEGVVSALQISTSPRNILIYGTSRGSLFKVFNANSSLRETFEITSSGFPNEGYVSSIAIDPTNANRIMVAFSNYGVRSIFLSEDGGQNFIDVSGNLEENADGTGNGPSVRWVNIVPKSEGGVEYFAGTSTGLYSALLVDGERTNWQQESPNGIGNSVVSMMDFRRVDGKAVVATHGNGLYTTTIPSVFEDSDLIAADEFSIDNIYPNPFSKDVTVKISVPQTQFILFRVYDTSGKLVKTVANALAFTGENEFFWDGTNVNGHPVSDGIYVVRITYLDQNLGAKVILRR